MSSEQVISVSFRLIFRLGKGHTPELRVAMLGMTTQMVEAIRNVAGHIYVDEYNVVPLRQEEILNLVPRKVHYAPDDSPHKWTRKLDGDQIPAQVCVTPRVGQRWLTKNPLETTCKLCLKWMLEKGISVIPDEA